MRWSDYRRVYLGYCTSKKRLRTVKNFDEPALNGFDFQGELAAVGPADLERWLAGLRAQYKQTTVAMRWDSLAAAFKQAVKMGLLAKSPFQGFTRLHRARSGRCLTDSERALMLDHAPEPLRNLMLFALNCGMRLGEVEALRWEHVRNGIACIPSDRRKNRKGLNMPLNSTALACMGRPAAGPVFVFSRRTIQGQLIKLCRRLDLGRIRFHDFRHTFVTEYLRNGRTKDLVEMGTHASEAGLSGYNHPPEELLRSRIELLAKERAPVSHASGYWGSSTTSTADILARGGTRTPKPFRAYAPQAYVVVEFDHLGLA
jgi:integrase